MTVADKLVYLSDTKNILADAINSYTQVITPDTPFREYAQWIDNIVFSAEGGLKSLFNDDEVGFLWPDLPYYQDPAGTTVASLGNSVGLISDDSGNGADFTQPTVTARPVLGRVPKGGQRNLLTRSGFDTQVVGAALPVGWSMADAGGMTTEVVDVGLEAGISYVDLRIFGAATGSTSLRRGFGYSTAAGDSKVFSAYCGIISGPALPNLFQIRLTETNLWGASYTSVPQGVPIARYSASRGTVTGNGLQPRFYFTHTSGLSYDYIVRIGNTQLEVGTVPSPYQTVTTEYDITESGVARKNLLKGTSELSSQNVQVGSKEYVLSFWGTGTVQLSGAYTGTLSGTGVGDRVDITFTPSFGYLHITVTGDVLRAQLEVV